ncbi:MAG: cyclase family protein [Candidatus Caldarchaeum sp.]|nr:cyclase family protein [Candidatus Caldarchaeum sp.]
MVYVDDLLQRISSCRVYDLSQPFQAGMPFFPLLRTGYSYLLYRRHMDANPQAMGPRSAASGLLVMPDHSGTHVDARCHQASGLRLYDGTEISRDVETPTGFTKHGAEQIPLMIARAVLVDVASVVKDPLPEHHLVSVEEFEGTLESEGVKIGDGDVVLMRTGYGRFWNTPSVYEKAAGASAELSKALAQKNILAVGADNLSWDVAPGHEHTKGHAGAGHLHLLAQRGIFIIENLYLEDLSRDKVYTSVFVCLPLKLVGATGAPVRPVCLR